MSTFNPPQILILAILGAGAVITGCNREEPQPVSSTSAPSPQSDEAAARTTENKPAATPVSKPTMTIPGVGSCEPSAEVSGVLTRISETADSNGNGQIEKEEAYSSADFLVGGFFFRADKNFDGNLTPDEGRAVRTELMNRHPTLSAIMHRAATTENSAALARMADLLGIQYDQAVSSSELRQAAHQLVDEVFRLSDADKNGSLTAGEAWQAGWSRMRALGSSAFLAYDSDNDKNLSLDEFQSALKESSRLAFDAADANKDGKLTQDEVTNAVQGVARRVWLPSAEPVKAADAKTPRAE